MLQLQITFETEEEFKTYVEKMTLSEKYREALQDIHHLVEREGRKDELEIAEKQRIIHDVCRIVREFS